MKLIKFYVFIIFLLGVVSSVISQDSKEQEETKSSIEFVTNLNSYLLDSMPANYPKELVDIVQEYAVEDSWKIVKYNKTNIEVIDKSNNVICSLSNDRFATAKQNIRIYNTDKEISNDAYICALCSLDDNRFVSGDMKGFVKIWDILSGQCLKKIKVPAKAVKVLCILNNNSFASGSNNGDIQIWDSRTFKLLQTLKEDTKDDLRCLCYLGNNLLAAGYYSGKLRIWDVKSGKCLKSFDAHTFLEGSSAVSKLCNLPNNRLASGSEDKKVKIWDKDSWECLHEIEFDKEILEMLYWMDGKLIVRLGGYQIPLKIVDTITGETLNFIEYDKFEDGHIVNICNLPGNRIGYAIQSDYGCGIFENPLYVLKYKNDLKKLEKLISEYFSALNDYNSDDGDNSLQGVKQKLVKLLLKIDGICKLLEEAKLKEVTYDFEQILSRKCLNMKWMFDLRKSLNQRLESMNKKLVLSVL